MLLNDEVMERMAPGAFHRQGGAINSIDFHQVQDLLVTSSDDNSLNLYNVQTSELMKTLYVRKYGASHVCFTHAPSCIISASGKDYSGRGDAEHDVRYHSFHDNQYLRFFKGHTARIVSLSMSTKSDSFLSASEDRSIRFWDLRTSACSGRLLCGPSPCVSYDHQGVVFAASTDNGLVKLYDARQYDGGPFDSFAVALAPGPPLASLRFSVDGKLLVACGGGFVFVLDAYSGQVMHTFSPHDGAAARGDTGATVSPDGQYVLAGGGDGAIRAWNTRSGKEAARWRGHAGVPGALLWHPRRCLVASGCTEGGLALWIPDPRDSEDAPAAA